jgi:hypothetical protein
MNLQPSSSNFYGDYDDAVNIDVSESFEMFSPTTYTGAGGGGGAY